MTPPYVNGKTNTPYQVSVTSSPDGDTHRIPGDVQAYLADLRERFKLCAEAEADVRTKSLEDLRFRAGEQWPDDIQKTREMDKRPCITINRIPQFLKQITNEFRLNPLAIKVNPVSGTDVETAEILQGLIRHIEVQSDAPVAYDTASEYAATMGFGYFRIITAFDNPESFQQEIYIKRIKNPFTVYFDPKCQEVDYSDAKFAFIVEELTEEEYKTQYPDSELASLTEFQSIGDRAPGWVSANSVRVAEYFSVEMEPRVLAMMPDRSIRWADTLMPGETPARTRTVEARRVKWKKINAVEILDEEDWAGQWIPIVPVLGEELDINGERYLAGIVRNAKDPQRMYNYWTSAETEMIALAPRVPFIGAEGQFENHEEQWRQLNTRNYAYVQYKPKSVGGELVPPPQRQTYEPPVQALSLARMQSADDLKATTGLYDASLGAISNERSGRAILARQQEGDTATFHFSDNRSRAIKACGRILVDLIPHIYSEPRVLRIIGEDDTVQMVPANQPFEKGGKTKIYDLTVGRYDVAIDVQPSYQTMRKEAVASMIDLAKVSPQVAALGSDLMVRSMDFPDAAQLADRLKRALPPQVQEEDENGPQASPQFVAQYQELAQQNQQLIGEVKILAQKLTSKEADIQQTAMTNESKERIAALQAQVDLIQTEATINAQNAQKLIAAEFSGISKKLDLLGKLESIKEPAATGPTGPS